MKSGFKRIKIGLQLYDIDDVRMNRFFNEGNGIRTGAVCTIDTILLKPATPFLLSVQYCQQH
jgi:hypothetical protein